MDLDEDLLPHARVHRRLFLCIESIQSRIAVEAEIEANRGDLVTGEQDGVIRIIVKVFRNFDDVISNPDDHCTFNWPEKPTRCHTKVR